MPGGIYTGVLDLALITGALAGTLWCVFHAGRIAEAALAVARRLRMLPPVPPTPAGMPIERIASDLRRIRPEANRPTPGMPMARRRGIVAAYDGALVDACRALGLETDLERIVDQLERESERLRTEAALERAGVDLG